MTSKICPKCGLDLPAINFAKASGQPSGLQTYCRKCSSAWVINKRRSNPRAAQDKQNAWRKTRSLEIRQREKETRQRRWKIIKETTWPEIYKRDRDRYRVNGHKRRAREARAKGEFTKNDIEFLLKQQKYKCIECKASVKDHYHIDHITPLCRGGSNEKGNLQILCPSCNLMKGAKDAIEFARYQGRLV